MSYAPISHILLGGALALFAISAPATAQYPWPVTPFHESQEITGTFCEYRDTGSSPHFHNGTDIPKPDGSPVYPVIDGRVTAISPNGSDAYVRVENFAYVHIAPSPSLAVGDSVFALQTVLGTILPGLGHVHLNDGYYDSERQALRKNTGITPYNDPWPPKISNISFFLATTGARFPGTALSGPVEITFRVREANGPPTASDSRLNNGGYIVGYQVLSRDRQTVVFSPAADGIQFRFDTKPSNAYVHNVYDPNQSSTSSHVYRVTNKAAQASYWDTALLPEGDYTVMLFAIDTRDNSDTVYVDISVSHQDLLPPAQPTFVKTVLENTALQAAWLAGNEVDLAGFRLFISPDNTAWTSFSDETTLDKASRAFSSGATIPSPAFFYLTAVDTAAPPNMSTRTDIYGVATDPQNHRLLLVDGFDRTEAAGSWHQPWHAFAYTHGAAVAANGFGFSTCANEAVTGGQVNLLDYEAVIWILGDESTRDETFSSAEQQRVREFLEAGGNLFVSGSEIAWDLDRDNSSSGTTAADEAFLNNYLKVNYAGDDAGNYSARGTTGGIFAGLQFSYGSSPYPEDYPDYFTPFGGGVANLTYGNGLLAGVQYEGLFGSSSKPGKLVILGFPFETITGAAAQRQVMERVLEYFFPNATAVAHDEAVARIPRAFVLEQNYPNPFRIANDLTPSSDRRTHIRFGLPGPAKVTFVLYDILGRQVKSWRPRDFPAGFHNIAWDGKDSGDRYVANGIYLLRMATEAERPRNSRWLGTVKIVVKR